MLMVFVGFFIIIQNQMFDEKLKKDQDTLTEMRSVISKEFSLAQTSNEGYSRVFRLPFTINGELYKLRFIHSTNPIDPPGEIGISYGGEEKPLFLIPNVQNYSVSAGENRISKFSGKISIVNSSGVCGDGTVQSPNFDLVFEQCEVDSECAPFSCNATTCYCNFT